MGTLAERLAKLREEAELSYYEVGKATGIHRNHIRLYELGQLMPPIEHLDKLAEYYDEREELYYLYFDELLPEKEQKQLILKWAKDRLQA